MNNSVKTRESGDPVGSSKIRSHNCDSANAEQCL